MSDFQSDWIILTPVLSDFNNLKSVRFFKLALRYDYSIVLYASGMHNAVVLCICVCVCLATLSLNVIQEVITHTDSAVLQ